MGKPNGSRSIERLAAALQDCLDSAADKAAQRVKQEMAPRFDRQDATLRMVWRQCGGDPGQRLPIDD